MKTNPLDFILSGVFITVIFSLAFALTACVLAPLTKTYLGDYHVLADLCLLLLGYGLCSAMVVRVLLRVRRIEAGEYSMDSSMFTYWKLLTVIYRLGQGALMPFTPVFLKPLIEKLLGAKVGANVALGGTIDDPYWVTIGEGVILGNGSLVSGNVITNGKIVFGEVKIGAGATVGANAVVLPGCTIGAGALVMGGAFVNPGTCIPDGETWRGNPARKWMGPT